MNAKLKGTICGIVAAVSYGTNPLGALYLYEQGLNAHSVLFYRFLLAAFLLGGYLLYKRESLRVSMRELAVLALLGILFGTSSLSLFMSFLYMDAGIASTILFVYPVMVAVMMAVFFHEKVTWVTIFSILLSLCGIGMLYKGGNGATLSTAGVLLVLLSSLTYAVYIIVVNRTSLAMSAVKMTFYVLIFCVMTVSLYSQLSPKNTIHMLTTLGMWGYALMLALVPTVISLIMMVISVHLIGSTSVAILGALEPLTAVLIGVTLFGEAFTLRLAVGILLILMAVLLIIVGKSFSVARLNSVLEHVRSKHLHR